MAPSSTWEPEEIIKIIANNAVSDMHRGRLVTVDAPLYRRHVPQIRQKSPDTHILDRTGIENHHMVAMVPTAEAMLLEYSLIISS